ncbi:MAG: fibrobacter succinogenes major paralogous domain-containing protein, partial [Bacteroidota bacterium]
REYGPGSSSNFTIVGINLDQTQTLLMTANTDTVGIGGVLDVQNNLNVTGDIGYTGTVTSLVPTLYTLEPYDITDSSAVVMGDISSNGGATIIVSGIVWSTLPTPTVDLVTKTTDGASTGQYASQITGLTGATTYYARAYATNANGTGYGQDVVFTTAELVVDFDDNQYNTVTIGTQVWLAENLKTTHLNDGTAIPDVTDDASWMVLSTPGYAWYNNDAGTYRDYGILYNWHTVNTGTLCPTGWHVPTDTEWTTLMSYAGGGYMAGGKLKETGTVHWVDPNLDATDEYSFTALPGGIRGYMGPFMDIGSTGNWWTSSMISVDPYNVTIYASMGEMMMMQMMSGAGMSVRCIKD